jgi:hypothetical protein
MDPTLTGRLANHASKLLVVFEVLNFTFAMDAFNRQRGQRQLTDYAGPLGSLMDLAGAIGKRIETTLERQERELALRVGRETYEESHRLIIIGRVLAVIGVIGGICDMIEARQSALRVAETLNYGQVIGFTVMFMGAALGVHSLIAAAAGATGPPGWVAVAIVLVGILLVVYSTDSPLETWFRNCQWGDHYLGRSVEQQLEKLNRLLATFLVELSYQNLRLDGWLWWADGLNVTIRPGFVQANSHFTVTTKAWKRGEARFGTIYDYDLQEIDSRVVTPRMDTNGRPQSITFAVSLGRNFSQRFRVEARLDLEGNGQVMVPGSGNAWWAFFLDERARALRVSNSDFPGL